MKYKFLMIMLLSMLVLCVGALAGGITALTVTAPATGAYVGDSYTFTGGYTGNSSGTINVTYNNVWVCSDTTVTAASSTWSCTGSLSGLSGISACTAYNLNASAYNTSAGGTLTASSANVANIYSDASSPTVSRYTSDYEGSLAQIFKDHAYTVTATDTCDSSLTYSVVLTKPDTQTVTKTTSTGTWRETDVDMLGSYSVAITVTDDASNTGTSTGSFEVKGKDDVEAGLVQIQTAKKQSTGTFMFLGLGAVFFLIVAGFGLWLFYKK